jgi:DNA-binding transcriptional MerR regulator
MNRDDDDAPRYYAISEVGELTDLEPHVLRFWQDKFDELQPRKNEAGRRTYTEEDVAVVRRIKQLLREERYTIEGARQVLARRDEERDQAFREELVEVRRFLMNLKRKM